MLLLLTGCPECVTGVVELALSFFRDEQRRRSSKQPSGSGLWLSHKVSRIGWLTSGTQSIFFVLDQLLLGQELGRDHEFEAVLFGIDFRPGGNSCGKVFIRDFRFLFPQLKPPVFDGSDGC